MEKQGEVGVGLQTGTALTQTWHGSLDQGQTSFNHGWWWGGWGGDKSWAVLGFSFIAGTFVHGRLGY